MKFWKRMIAVAAGALLLAGTASACGNKTPDSATDLEIFVWRNGYGLEYFNAIAEAFQEEYPQYNLIPRNSSNDEFASSVELGPERNSIDLYFTSSPNQTMNQYLEPLDDVLDDSYGDEQETIAGKYDTELLKNFQNSDHTYVLSYASSYMGIVYKENMLDPAIGVPRTTNQLIEWTDAIVRDHNYPFIHFGTEGYWSYFWPVWQAQYDGMDYFQDNFLMLTDEEGNAPSKDVYLKQDGRYQTLLVLDQLLQAEKIAPGSSGQDFTTAQTRFLNSSNIAMMVTGTWLNNEMGTDNDNIKMMKTPVISSIINNPRLEGSIEDDDELSALIDAVDAAASAEEVPIIAEDGSYSVTPNDAKAIYEARNIMYCLSDDAGMCIPKGASAAEAAKDFIRFFHSDQAMKIYEEVMDMPLPYSYSDGSEYDSSDWSDWNKNILKLQEESIPLMMKVVKKSEIFLSGGATPYADLVPVVEFVKATGRPDADTLWTRLQQTINDNWRQYLINAGFGEGA